MSAEHPQLPLRNDWSHHQHHFPLSYQHILIALFYTVCSWSWQPLASLLSHDASGWSLNAIMSEKVKGANFLHYSICFWLVQLLQMNLPLWLWSNIYVCAFFIPTVNKDKCWNINYIKLHCLFIKTITHESLINFFSPIASNIKQYINNNFLNVSLCLLLLTVLWLKTDCSERVKLPSLTYFGRFSQQIASQPDTINDVIFLLNGHTVVFSTLIKKK